MLRSKFKDTLGVPRSVFEFSQAEQGSDKKMKVSDRSVRGSLKIFSV